MVAQNTISASIASTTAPQTTKVENMSAAGIGNATLGNLAADGIKSLLTSEDYRPATRRDLKMLFE